VVYVRSKPLFAQVRVGDKFIYFREMNAHVYSWLILGLFFIYFI
jgi:hypothetical protein